MTVVRKILIVTAPFYEELTKSLLEGAEETIKQDGSYQCDIIEVPGVLEIPTAIYHAAQSDRDYVGYIALGVVIRGETAHYEIVCRESARGLMDLGTRQGLAIGNGIQTVDNEAQAWARCKKDEKNKGGHAAKACLALIGISDNFSRGKK